MIKGLATFSALAAAMAMAACTVHQSDSAPSLTGPSDFAQSIRITSNPDRLTQDGQSQSAITIQVFDASGSPVNGVPIRVDMLVGGTLVDFGKLSARNVVTLANGRATVVYTAPAAPPPLSSDTTTTVTIRAIAVGTNAQSSNPFSTDIRLVPPGVILPPADTPTASFTVSPTPASANVPLNFDASASVAGTGANSITSYAWTFGDGSAASGRTVTKTFTTPGTFNVTLTVTNDRGLAASTTQAVSVGTTTAPTASFTFSPTAPAILQVVNFNAAASSAAPGRSIASYSWNFGDGSATKGGVTAQHDFGLAGTYSVSLTVTDDVGQKSTAAQSVTVTAGPGGGTPGPPTAAFVISPTAPQVNQTVNFNADASRAGTGRTIANYGWNFGDGTAISVATSTTTHSFAAAGTYNVTLTVTDDAGQRSVTATQTLSIVSGGSGGGTTSAVFTYSPLTPSALQPVFFNASGSTAAAGRTLTTYAWNFGDGTLVTGSTFSATHTFTAAGTFTVTLTVTDDIGQTGRVATPVIVAAAGAGSLTAGFSISPTDPTSGQLVTFNANLSSPVASIIAYDWDFGDGVIVNNQPGFIITHTYFTVTGNTFTIRLTVHDNTGRIATTTGSLSVRPGSDPVARFTVTPSPTSINTTVTFDGTASTAAAGKSIVRYEWDFGDGSPIVATTGPTTTKLPGPGYAATGTYTIRLTVFDSAGLSAATTRTLLVQ